MDALNFTSCGSGSDDNGHNDDESCVCMTGNNATLSSRLLQNYVLFPSVFDILADRGGEILKGEDSSEERLKSCVDGLLSRPPGSET